MASGRGVENDVVVVRSQCCIGEERREFVEGCDLGGPRTGQLLLNAFDRRRWQNAPYRADDAVTIRMARSRMKCLGKQTGLILSLSVAASSSRLTRWCRTSSAASARS